MKKMICAGVVAALLSSGAFATLQVSNLPAGLDNPQQNLHDLFSHCGGVKAVQEVKSKTVGEEVILFTSVTMADVHGENCVIDKHNGKPLDGFEMPNSLL